MDSPSSAPAPSDFTTCTIFNDPTQYAEVCESWVAAGFKDSTFLGFDNCESNQFDPYRVINQVLADPPTPYLIFCHQDVRLNRGHGFNRLADEIHNMNGIDPEWAVLGNAGCTNVFEYVKVITDPSGTWTEGDFPVPVVSLDENFLVIRAASGVRCSEDLSGFHLYATDLCLNALKAVKNSYVIDFHLTHLSLGTLSGAYFDSRRRFVDRWARETPFLAILTPSTPIIVCRNRFLRRLLSSPKISGWLISHNSLIRRFQRFPGDRS